MNASYGPGSAPLTGTIAVPGDKSLSHRAVLFAAMAQGTSRVSGVLDSADVRATVGAVTALGAQVKLCRQSDGTLSGEITGWGSNGPCEPVTPIDCGNSGTTTRLLMGVVAGWPITVTLTGDESLSRRPMRRVSEPLAAMGARFELSAGGTLPVTVHGAAGLSAFHYDSPVASAQVKTAILLAGLRAQGLVTVSEPALSRDHTERLLPAFGVPVTVDDEAVTSGVEGPAVPVAHDVVVPGDPSSAAFMVAAALIVPGSAVSVAGVSLNETRIGFARVLERMYADLTIEEGDPLGSEPTGILHARFTPLLISTVVHAHEIPALVDEVPILAVVAARAAGTTRFEGVGELRVKESDRLQAIVDGLTALGVTVRAGEDWLEVDGPAAFDAATLDSLGDHRLAMSWAVAGLVARGPIVIGRFESVEVSYPEFAADLAALAG